MSDDYLGCGSSSCGVDVQNRHGQLTNGPCRCFDEGSDKANRQKAYFRLRARAEKAERALSELRVNGGVGPIRSVGESVNEMMGVIGPGGLVEQPDPREHVEEMARWANWGRHLRDLRRARGLSQRAFGERCGVNFTYISRIENGVFGPPSGRTIERMADVLGVDAIQLARDTGKAIPSESARLRQALRDLLDELPPCQGDFPDRCHHGLFYLRGPCPIAAARRVLEAT